MTDLFPISELLAVGLTVSVPVVFGLLGGKGLVRAVTGKPIGKAETFSIAGMTFFAGLLGYGWQIEPRWIEETHVEIDVPGDVSLRVVHLSDLHIEEFSYRERRALEIVREAKADVVVVTGDLTDPDLSALEATRQFLSKLRAPHVYSVTGNWDTRPGPIFEGLENITWLEAETEVIEVRGARILIHGSPFAMPPEIITQENDFSLFLNHSPDLLKEASEKGYDLYLAGHTHGSQVSFPFIGRGPIVMSRYGYNRGLYREGNTLLYVNRGLGLEGELAPRLRLFSRPEVTVLDLL